MLSSRPRVIAGRLSPDGAPGQHRPPEAINPPGAGAVRRREPRGDQLEASQVLLKSPDPSMALVESSWSPLLPTIVIEVGFWEPMELPLADAPE